MQTHDGRIRLSYSALSLFHTCERKFQLERLLEGAPEKRDYPATVLGKAYGEGIATYLSTGCAELSLFATYMAYTPVIEDNARTETVALNLVTASIPQLDTLLLDWEVAIFNGKPAVELSFCLEIDDKFYYVGYIDVVLRNKWNGKYAILENKTTSLKLYDISCLYANSGQALGYSIVLDAIAGEENSEYEVIYCAAQLGSGNGYEPKINILPFKKTLSDRLNWFITLQMDVNRLTEMLSINVFPMRGHNCMQYMRPCQQFGTCQLHSLDKYLPSISDEVKYDFTYQLDEVILNHMNRIK